MRPLIDFAGFNAVSSSMEILDQQLDFVPRDRLRCIDLLELHHAWVALPRREGELPDYEDFDEGSFQAIEPKISRMVVKDWQAGDMEYATYGQHPATFLNRGKPLTMAELWQDPKRRDNYVDIKNRVGRCIDKRQPNYVHKRLNWGARGFVSYEVIFLPFRSGENEHIVLTPVSAYDSGSALGEIPV